MTQTAITISTHMDAQLFRDFALFDTFRIKKKWRSPAVFALLFLGFAALCFSRYPTADQAILIGAVLLVVGLGLPLVYFLYFLGSVKTQVRTLGLQTPKLVYTLTFPMDSDAFQIQAKNGETAQWDWDRIHGVYRGKDCIYLYVQANRAFLLPERDIAPNTELFEELLQQKAPGKTHGK